MSIDLRRGKTRKGVEGTTLSFEEQREDLLCSLKRVTLERLTRGGLVFGSTEFSGEKGKEMRRILCKNEANPQ